MEKVRIMRMESLGDVPFCDRYAHTVNTDLDAASVAVHLSTYFWPPCLLLALYPTIGQRNE